MRFYSMSAQIEEEKQEYYRILETSQKGTLNITAWLEWFLGCFERAVVGAARSLERILSKAARWERIGAMFEPNERQRKVLNALKDAGEEEVSTSKYAKLAGISLDTALRDIKTMVEAGVLRPGSGGGRSRKYELHFPR
jgi:Fic family protein